MKAVSVKRKNSLPPFRLKLGAGFTALVAVIYFFDENGLLAAMLPAVVIHELGHIGALLLMGNPPRALNATLSGLSLDYAGELSKAGRIFCSLSGPASGLLFAWLCSVAGNRFESEYLLLASGAGLIMNIFNILPAVPLDGGYALLAFLESVLPGKTAKRISLALGIVISLALILCGTVFFAMDMGFALIPAGIWLFLLQMNEIFPTALPLAE